MQMQQLRCVGKRRWLPTAHVRLLGGTSLRSKLPDLLCHVFLFVAYVVFDEMVNLIPSSYYYPNESAAPSVPLQVTTRQARSPLSLCCALTLPPAASAQYQHNVKGKNKKQKANSGKVRQIPLSPHSGICFPLCPCFHDVARLHPS